MANEAVIIELLGNGGDPISFTVADGTAVTKGTLMKLSDPRTAAATSADNDIFCGIAAQAKVASDGQTRLSLYTHGIFDLYASNSTITIGQDVTISGANDIKTFTTLDNEKGYKVGKALETSAAGTAETIAVLINLS